MKHYLKCKFLLAKTLLVLSLLISSTVSANLINADFSINLNGWSGDVNYFDGIDEVSSYDVNFADFGSNFSTGLNSVSLNTSEDQGNEFWGIYLFQEFLVEQDSLLLSLELDFLADDAFATLVDENGDLLHDFIIDGLAVDISTWAGSFVALELGIEDFDYVYDDYLTVSNIAISQASTSVPTPSTLALFSIALIALRRKAKSVSRTA
ncbi:hypothetical protein [Paraglaciecola arctica]|uniref:hypothetical protein n=1 Tax=Paraglaciecola arctica TaxID=1128911 RepID=UPI001C06F8E6|nr:hypothetical protein [Paraglaciecola arctica]MBU3005263.1 hypothetical protein [Paraglaciecola arctica]